MNPEEHLREVKQQLDDAVVAALENMETPGLEGLRTCGRPIQLAYKYRRALMEAAGEVGLEIAEHYEGLATVAVPNAEFLLAAICGYRAKHRIS